MNTDLYVNFLISKGFRFGEEAIGFINFGKGYTSAPDWVVNLAIEYTLKAQKTFDGGFFMSLLEELVNQKVSTRREGIALMTKRGLLID